MNGNKATQPSPTNWQKTRASVNHLLVASSTIRKPLRTQDSLRYPCLDCEQNFRRCNELARHGEDKHQPELKLVCPSQGCDYRIARSRFYRMREHFNKQHGPSTAIYPELCVPKSFIDKIWACGFYVTSVASWNELAKHIWAHYQAGIHKHDWKRSLYIQSLLQHPSVCDTWLALTKNRVDGGQLEWSDGNLQDLYEELEWIRPGRKEGSALAKMAFDRLKFSRRANSMNYFGDRGEAYMTFEQRLTASEHFTIREFLEQTADPWNEFASGLQPVAYQNGYSNEYVNERETSFSRPQSSDATSQSDNALASISEVAWVPTLHEDIAPAASKNEDVELARWFETLQFQNDTLQPVADGVEQAAASRYSEYPQWGDWIDHW